jgi:hypothetical protein
MRVSTELLCIDFAIEGARDNTKSNKKTDSKDYIDIEE